MATGDSSINRCLQHWTRSEAIEGLLIRQLASFGDDRGTLIELFRNDEMLPKHAPAMSYISYTNPGQARGPHEHLDQTDMFVFFPGITLKLWDNRDISSTYKNKLSMTFDRITAVVVPCGVVHGYVNNDRFPVPVLNFPNRLYKGQYKKYDVDEIRHENNPDSPFKMF